MLQYLGFLFIPAMLLLGAALVVLGVLDETKHELAIAGSVMLGSVLIALAVK